MMDKNKFLDKTIHIYIFIGFTLLFVSFILVATPIWPYVWYRVNPNQTKNDVEFELACCKLYTREEAKEEQTA